MAGVAVLFSKYYSELEGEAKSRYERIMRMIGLVDPYFLLENSSPLSVEWYECPDVMYADIYNFFIKTTSYCTHKQLKDYKSLDGYNFWVTNMFVFVDKPPEQSFHTNGISERFPVSDSSSIEGLGSYKAAG